MNLPGDEFTVGSTLAGTKTHERTMPADSRTCPAPRIPSAVDDEEGYIPGAGGVRLHYRVLGTGSPVVVVHGGLGGSMKDLMLDLEPLSAGHPVRAWLGGATRPPPLP
jgi:hypothetical protein